jgi:hypothetical protein
VTKVKVGKQDGGKEAALSFLLDAAGTAVFRD